MWPASSSIAAPCARTAAQRCGISAAALAAIPSLPQTRNVYDPGPALRSFYCAGSVVGVVLGVVVVVAFCGGWGC